MGLKNGAVSNIINSMVEGSFKETLFNSIKNLSPDDREVFNRIFKVNIVKGDLAVPPAMEPWVISQFGSVSAIENQIIVKASNLITYEGSVFNDLRSKRPDMKISLGETFDYKCGSEMFCSPLNNTPEDVFGRIKGKYSLTASNIAKIDGFHSVIIFKDHNPLDFNAEKIHDYFEVANSYFKKANEHNKSFVYPFFMWNCLWKAGASITHGHAQVTVAKDVTYSKIGLLRSRSLWYQEEYKSNYFNDVFNVHHKLGLGFMVEDVKVMAYLCPIKERGITIYAKSFDGSLSFAVNSILRTLVNKFGVRSFNLIAIPHPITPTYESWEYMPVILEIVDRGSLETRHSDFGSMELYAQSVVGSNPYDLVKELKSEIMR